MGNCTACKASDASASNTLSADDAAALLDSLQVVDDTPIAINDVSLWSKARQISSVSAVGEEIRRQVSSASRLSTQDTKCASLLSHTENVEQDMQLWKVARHDGFLVALDATGKENDHHNRRLKRKATERHDPGEHPIVRGAPDSIKDAPQEATELELQEKLHAFRLRTITDEHFDGERIIGCSITEDLLDETIHGMPCPDYLWKEKSIVPILSVALGLAPEQNGVQLMEANMEKFDQLLTMAAEHAVFGVKVRSVITHPNAVGIKSLIDQQLEVCQRIVEKNLVPILQPEIQFSSPEKLKCEEVLIDVLIDALDRLASEMMVILVLTMPTTPNLYLPLVRHRNILRLAALSCGHDRSTACKMIRQNVGMIANFSRTLTDDLCLSESDADFSRHLDGACQAFYQASHVVDDSVVKMARIAEQPGFIILMTQSSLEPLLSAADQQALDVQHKMSQCFKRIVLSEKLNCARVVAVFADMEFFSLEVDEMPVSQYLWKFKGVIPLVIFSHELDAESHGVQLLHIPPNFVEVLEKALALGAFGVQLRGMINEPDKSGIDRLVSQQFRLSMRMMEMGLLPNMMLEVNPDCKNKVECEELLLNSILAHLGNLTPEQKVTFTLTMPSKPNLYLTLSEHANTLLVGATSRGYTCADACRKLSDNDKLVGVFGRAFTERFKSDQSDKEVCALVGDTCKMIHQAVTSVSAREEQMRKFCSQDGVIAGLDLSLRATVRCLKRYGIDTDDCKKEINTKWHQMFARIVTDDSFDGSRVIGTIMTEKTMNLSICGLPTPKYLWNQKGTVPFLTVESHGLMPEADGVQLMNFEAKKDTQELLDLLDRAGSIGVFGTKQHCFIKQPNAVGIKAGIDQQLEVASHVWAKGLLPMWHLEVDIHCPEQAMCEQLLADMLLDAIEKLRSNEKVVLLMTLPCKPNFYMSLMSHPNVVRLIAVSGGHSQKYACKMLQKNVNVIGGFGRAFVEGLCVTQTPKEFSKVLNNSCAAILDSSKSVGAREEQLIKLSSQDGFFVGFEQDAQSMPKMLKSYGMEDQYEDEAALNEKAHEMHNRIVTNLQMNGSRVLGIILTEYATGLTFARLPSAKYLWEVMRIVPFMKLDKGLAAEEDGVCLMKEPKQLSQRLNKAIKAGISGTITRSVIRLPDQRGIRSLVDQQIHVSKMILNKRLLPILHIEVDIASPDKSKCERVLVKYLCRELDKLNPDQRVVVELTLPETPGTYSKLIEHPNVIRVAGCSGGYKRKEAVRRLEENGHMIASFGRAFAEGLHVTQTDLKFTGTLVRTCKLLYNASRATDKAEAGEAIERDARLLGG